MTCYNQHLIFRVSRRRENGYLIEHPVEDSHIVDSIQLMNRALPTPLRTLDVMHLSIAIGIGSEALATADIAMATAAQALDLHAFNFGVEPLTRRKIVKRLKKHGIAFDRQAAGSRSLPP